MEKDDDDERGQFDRMPLASGSPAGMQRLIIIALLLAIIVGGTAMFVITQDRAAIRSDDYYGCWTDNCKSVTAGNAARRLRGY